MSDTTAKAQAQHDAARAMLDALKEIIGDRHDKWGYCAAANVMDDDIRGRAKAAIVQAEAAGIKE